uniref:Nucleoprotein n=1 Tax=Hubei insect virus 1 TaxID=1922897 RepID=A0A1L3KPD0_9VIRU|nr:nucleoprotein [Hubei insect virus 1]
MAGFGQCWNEIMTSLKIDDSLDFLVTEIDDIVTQQDEILAGWSEAVLYQGFDVVRTLKILKKNFDDYMEDHRDDAPITVTFRYSKNDGGEGTFEYDNKRRILIDVSMILFLFANRGASWEKIKDKSREEFRIVMDFLKGKYNIDTTVREGGTTLKADDIIVSRIAACFPLKVVEFFHAGRAKALFHMNKLGVKNLSKGILSNHFVSVIPSGLDEKSQRSLLLMGFLTCALNDKVLHRKDGKYTKAEQMLVYFSASYNSVAVPNAARVRACKQMGILTSGGAAVAAIINAEDTFKANIAATINLDVEDCTELFDGIVNA